MYPIRNRVRGNPLYNPQFQDSVTDEQQQKEAFLRAKREYTQNIRNRLLGGKFDPKIAKGS
ncbi:MAG: hypothetical protein DLM68_18380 [Hyphomicrobiales bacterium]|nr:MAG: hypothetical protein DLM68_18380 [Hyphomicrobiales bacterium]